MRKILSMLTTFFVLISFTACENAENNSSEIKSDITTETETTSQLTESIEKTSESQLEPNSESIDVTSNKEIAVVYFSATGTTAEIAELIADETDADIYEIIPKITYSSDDLNYNDDNCRANKEQNDDSARPEIESDLSAVEEYEIVYLGYPIWWGEEPRIIDTFLEGYDFSDKTIIPFCTSASSGITASEKNIANLVPIGTQLEGKRFSASSSETEVHNWIDGLEIMKEE